MWLSILTRPVSHWNRNLNNNISTPCYLKKSFTFMRADWAISRPSVRVMLFTGILIKTKFDYLCTCNCQKKKFISYVWNILWVWWWRECPSLEKKASVQHIRETLPVSLNNGTRVITSTYRAGLLRWQLVASLATEWF